MVSTSGDVPVVEVWFSTPRLDSADWSSDITTSAVVTNSSFVAVASKSSASDIDVVPGHPVVSFAADVFGSAVEEEDTVVDEADVASGAGERDRLRGISAVVDVNTEG